jgi:DNA-binding transcriptional ArsR family regulator
VTSTFDVVGEPTRRRILDLLREGPRPVGELVGLIGCSQPGTSRHLRVLRDAGLVAVRPEAQRRLYVLRPQPLAEIDAWLTPYRELWANRLDALEQHLDDLDAQKMED